jgi:cytochrome c-type biogenesis protein CcmH/NrfG
MNYMQVPQHSAHWWTLGNIVMKLKEFHKMRGIS